MTVPTPPNTAEIAGFVRRVVDDELIGLAIHDANGDELDNTLVAYIIADVVMAVPSVASALALRQTVLDEPPRRSGQDAEYGISNDYNTGWNTVLDHLRAVVEEDPL